MKRKDIYMTEVFSNETDRIESVQILLKYLEGEGEYLERGDVGEGSDLKKKGSQNYCHVPKWISGCKDLFVYSCELFLLCCLFFLL